MRVTTQDLQYTSGEKNITATVNDLRIKSNYRKTLIVYGDSFIPVKFPFNVISVQRYKKEHVIMLNSYFK